MLCKCLCDCIIMAIYSMRLYLSNLTMGHYGLVICVHFCFREYIFFIFFFVCIFLYICLFNLLPIHFCIIMFIGLRIHVVQISGQVIHFNKAMFSIEGIWLLIYVLILSTSCMYQGQYKCLTQHQHQRTFKGDLSDLFISYLFNLLI